VETAAQIIDTSPSRIIVLIHGIRTHASWAEMVAAILEPACSAKVIPIKYGYLDVFRFLFPLYTRRAPVQRILRELRDIRSDNPNSRISVVAHSFGTYAIVKALLEREIVLDRLIFCGCIVRNNFRRADYKAQLSSDLILNDCGTHDIWPIVAQSITWGYGATGTFGFGTNGVRDRFNKFGHGQYFDRAFIEHYWTPYLRDGVIRSTEWEKERTAPPWWQSLFSWLPLKYLFLALLFAGAFFTWRWADGTREVRVELAPDIVVGHFIGTPAVMAKLRVINETRHDVDVKSLALTLLSPDGKETPMQIEGVVMLGQLQGKLLQIFARPKETVEFQYSFFNDSPELEGLIGEVNANFMSSGMIVYSPDKSKELIPQEIADRLLALAKSKFIWKTGQWRIRFTASWGERGLSTERSITLTEDEIQRMWRITDHYRSGIGVFPNWRYLSLDDFQPTLTKLGN
jgi:hypothetical protein